MTKDKTILDQLIKEIHSNNLTDQIRELCDIIQKEESISTDNIPEGPNIFLVVEVPGTIKDHIGCLTLERESEYEYNCVYWKLTGTRILKGKCHKIEGNTPKKILYNFAKLVKIYRGE